MVARSKRLWASGSMGTRRRYWRQHRPPAAVTAPAALALVLMGVGPALAAWRLALSGHLALAAYSAVLALGLDLLALALVADAVRVIRWSVSYEKKREDALHGFNGRSVRLLLRTAGAVLTLGLVCTLTLAAD